MPKSTERRYLFSTFKAMNSFTDDFFQAQPFQASWRERKGNERDSRGPTGHNWMVDTDEPLLLPTKN